MSSALYNFGGLRFWDEEEIKSRNRISEQISETIISSLRGVNQGWATQQVDTPIIMPRELMNEDYTDNDVFALSSKMGESDMALRAETTNGSYLMAKHILGNTKTKPPLMVWQLGQSFRRETSDGATAEKLRFNSFYQLEFQLIYGETTHFDYGTLLREKLLELTKKITGLDTRLIDSDRIPSYSTETVDIEVLYNGGWKEVASTSHRIDFPEIKNFPKGKLKVFEVAFGADRMCCVSQGNV